MRARGRAFWFSLALLACARHAVAQEKLDIDLGSGVALEAVKIPGGSFRQGSPPSEAGRANDEHGRDVTISTAFYLGKYPVTRLEFATFVSASGYRTEAEKGASGGSGWDGAKLSQRKDFTWRTPGFTQTDVDPVTLVTYADAEAFTAWLTSRAHRRIRLPREAEWEYAARAGTTTAYYGGTSAKDALALGWFKENAGNGTRAVGQKTPNAFGLYDMGGNVYQWCADWYAPYGADPAIDPFEENDAGDTARRVLRGGSWLKEPSHGRSAARFRNAPGSRNADNGFRVVAELDSAAAAAPTPVVSHPIDPVYVVPSSGGSGSSMLWLALGGGIMAALAGVLWVLFGGKRPSSGSGTVATRVVADGFWIDLATLPPGARVRYECTVRGTPVTDVVTVDAPRETFVYTGGAPLDVRIVEVIAPEDPRQYAQQQQPQWQQPSRPIYSDPTPSPPRPFQGFPPAY